MPSVVLGPINITENGGVVHFGDSLNISPKATAKSFSGSGGGNTGNYVLANNGISATNTIDSQAVDQPMTGNL
ncbi:spore germination protein [Ammoniphilus sp. YIM 78166]|uniref:spore germination protein n=1 Tax=Ammoniphilus sp. YIM 78166 TaxID=1644106 RepID=UPI00106F126A|nr:spore germination protein [Ammoniphilus sp. YIM 78166]